MDSEDSREEALEASTGVVFPGVSMAAVLEVAAFMEEAVGKAREALQGACLTGLLNVATEVGIGSFLSHFLLDFPEN